MSFPLWRLLRGLFSEYKKSVNTALLYSILFYSTLFYSILTDLCTLSLFFCFHVRICIDLHLFMHVLMMLTMIRMIAIITTTTATSIITAVTTTLTTITLTLLTVGMMIEEPFQRALKLEVFANTIRRDLSDLLHVSNISPIPLNIKSEALGV